MRKTRLGLTCLYVAGILFYFMHAVSFSQEGKLTLSELSQRAEVVVIGKVASVQSSWNNARTKIQTRVEIVINERLKGRVEQSSLTIMTLGGEVNGIGESYSHMAKFSRDEDVVVFAARDQSGQYRVTAGEQGKLTIKQDASSKKVVGDGMPLEVLRSDIRLALKKDLAK
jgi:hypothetical protein